MWFKYAKSINITPVHLETRNSMKRTKNHGVRAENVLFCGQNRQNRVFTILACVAMQYYFLSKRIVAPSVNLLVGICRYVDCRYVEPVGIM